MGGNRGVRDGRQPRNSAPSSGFDSAVCSLIAGECACQVTAHKFESRGASIRSLGVPSAPTNSEGCEGQRQLSFDTDEPTPTSSIRCKLQVGTFGITHSHRLLAWPLRGRARPAVIRSNSWASDGAGCPLIGHGGELARLARHVLMASTSVAEGCLAPPCAASAMPEDQPSDSTLVN